MKQRYTYILATLMGILLFAGCSDDDMSVALKGDPTEVYVNVTISIGGTQGMTRATVEAPGDGTPALSLEDGSLQDSYIDPEDVELFVFDQNNKFVSRVDIFSRTHMGTTTNVDDPDASTENYQCLIVGSIEMEDLNNGHYHLVAVCNQNGTLEATQSTLTEGTTILDDLIDGITYSGYDSDFTGSLLTGHTGTFDKDNINDGNYTQNARIPMWGICTVSLAKGKMVTAPIAVLRSMAKVRVAIGGDAKTNGYTLTKVTLNTANTGGTLAAKKDENVVQAYVSATNTNGTADDTNDDFKTYTTAWNSNTVTNITTPSIPSVSTTSNLSFSTVTENGTDYYVIYIPEYKNIGATTPATITLGIKDASGNAIKDSEGNDYILHFADYSATTAPTAPEWDIIRNDIYDYTITKITETGGLEANVRVMPWQYETMEYELSQAPVVTIGWSEGWPVCYDGINYGVPTCYENEGYYATFYVDVSIPEGVKWQAHLTNPIDFEFDPAFANYGYAHISNDEDAPTDYYGNKAERVTVKVRPKGAFRSGVRRITNLYFTLETLVGADKKATIKWWADNTTTKGYYDGNQVLQGIEGNGLFPMLGDADDPPGEGKMVRIVQISESEWEGYRYANLDSWKEQQYQAEQAANE